MSYTETHKVEHNHVCEPCRMSMSGDCLFPEVIELWNQQHEGCSESCR